MTSKPHDALFKAAFEHPAHAADLFRCTLPESLREGIDYGSLTREDGSFIDPELADRHSDLLFSARLRGDRVFLNLLLEHQSTNDGAMPLRIIDYLARIWKRHLKDNPLPLPLIIPLVVSHAPEGWTAATTFHQLVAPDPATIPSVIPFVPSFEILVEDLAHLSNEDLRSRALTAFHQLALYLLRDARDIEGLVRNALLWADAATDALRTPNGMEAVALLFRYVARITDGLNFNRFRDNILSKSTELERATMTMTAAEEWIREGRAEGRAEGRVLALCRQLQIKFGEIADEYRHRLDAATEEQLDNYLARVLSAQTIEEVFADPS
ncbi:MAG: Rpn family recombination-promoting nuclease/putative transposase [Enhygromyxa sp.]